MTVDFRCIFQADGGGLTSGQPTQPFSGVFPRDDHRQSWPAFSVRPRMVKFAVWSRSHALKALALIVFLALCPALAMAQEKLKSPEIQKIEARLAVLDRSWRRDQAFLEGYKRNGVIRVREGSQAYIDCSNAITRSQQAVTEALTLEARKAELGRAAAVNRTASEEDDPFSEHTNEPKSSPKAPVSEKPSNRDTLKPAGAAGSAAGATRPPKVVEIKPGKASKPAPAEPPSPKAVPPPIPAVVSNYKPSGAGAFKILQEVRDADPVQKQELEFLEKRMDEIEVSLLAGMKKAASGGKPFQDLEGASQELKQVSALLDTPEKCSYKNAIDTLTELLARTGAKFEEKSRKTQTGKAAYVEMLKEIERAKIRVDALRVRFTALKHDVDGLVKNASDWITLYNDVLDIKGEAAARKTLTHLLAEKEKTWQKK